MKKLLIVLAAAFVFSAALYCEEGFNLDVGAGVSVSAILKPYADVDANINYEFSNGMALGLGVKENFNFTPGRKISDGEKGEALCYTQPYLLFKAGYFTMAGGLCISTDTDPVYNNVYGHIGSDIPLWDAGSGKIGIDCGLEGWLSLAVVEPVSSSGGDQFAAGLGSLFTTLLNTAKFNLGVKYYLPL